MKKIFPLLALVGIAYWLTQKKTPPIITTDSGPTGTGTYGSDSTLLDPSGCGPGGCKIPTNPNYAKNNLTAVGYLNGWTY
ncbi:MAG: hypothetical protein IPO85_12425 [Saprospiraceae bacterium]|uniref:Uncharacterized protein n=1 Tax=Candidatus Defluviibacterium haderslevense TaxID=2981993 RepID=A0A9D7SAB6_9BACT|nr:hypothetical protein [Candidatus Defluviibacterium haderslevense]